MLVCGSPKLGWNQPWPVWMLLEMPQIVSYRDVLPMQLPMGLPFWNIAASLSRKTLHSRKIANACCLKVISTAFSSFNRPRAHGLGPIKRLWQFLVRQPPVQNVFVKYIFSKRRLALGMAPSGIPESQSYVSRLSAEAGQQEALDATDPHQVRVKSLL